MSPNSLGLSNFITYCMIYCCVIIYIIIFICVGSSAGVNLHLGVPCQNLNKLATIINYGAKLSGDITNVSR